MVKGNKRSQSNGRTPPRNAKKGIKARGMSGQSRGQTDLRQFIRKPAPSQEDTIQGGPKPNNEYNLLASLIPCVVTCTKIEQLNKVVDESAATSNELAATTSPIPEEASDFEEGSTNLHAAFPEDTSDDDSDDSQGGEADGKPEASPMIS